MGCNNILRESWAEYVGWELTEAYYAKQNRARPSYSTISGCNNQLWKKTDKREKDNGTYSPLFTDLSDNYNQRDDGVEYPNDMISDVPYSFIHELSRAGNWDNFKEELQRGVGLGYFTQAQHDEFIADYDYWRAHHTLHWW